MGKEVRFILERGTKLSDEEIAMIEAARDLPFEDDEDNPAVDPEATPERYAALMRSVAERNQRVIEKLRQMG